MTNERDTIGKISAELLQKAPESRDPIELERAMHADYGKNVFEAVERGIKEYMGDFYIVVTTKMEPLMKNVLRNYYFPRQSCPTPDYDQTVYRYHRNDDKIEFLWVVPSRETCEKFKEHALEIAPEEKELLYFVMEFYDGDLLKKSKRLNRELATSNILEG